MKIVIVANFCRGQKGNLEDREVYLAECIASRGHDVTLVTSDYSHLTKEHKDLSSETEVFKSKIELCHEPGYVKHASIKRLWSHHVWGMNVLRYIKTLKHKPDIIYCAIPSLTAPVLLSKYCTKNSIKFAIDVQDLWPEATFMLIKNKIIQKISLPMSWYINKAYSKADAIVAVSDTYVERAISVNHNNPLRKTVFLGNDGELFENSRKLYIKERSDDEFHLCYIGTLSHSYDIKCVINALSILNSPKIKLIICGDGPMRKEFEDYAESQKINCDFKGSLPYSEMVGVLCSCDAVVNPIVEGAAQSITNKVGDYALSGLPVINTQECEEYRTLIEQYGCGINCRVGNMKDVAEAIKKLITDDIMRIKMGQNARKLGLERFDRRNTYQRIISALESL